MAEWDNTKLKETVSIGIHLSRTQPSLLTNTTINSEALAESLELAVHFLLPSLYSYTYPFTSVSYTHLDVYKRQGVLC